MIYGLIKLTIVGALATLFLPAPSIAQSNTPVVVGSNADVSGVAQPGGGQPATGIAPSADAVVISQTVISNHPTYDAATQTMIMPDGTRMPLSELAPGYDQNAINSLQGVNAKNLGQVSASASENQQSSTNLDGQAYRTQSAGAARSSQYAAVPVDPAQTPIAVADPNGAPGVFGFTPNLYFIGARPVVVVSVTLTGGAGPASVTYRTSGGTLAAGSYYTPVQGQLAWARGESGTKTFSVPIDASAIARDGVRGRAITVALTGGVGAQLAGATAARIVVP